MAQRPAGELVYARGGKDRAHVRRREAREPFEQEAAAVLGDFRITFTIATRSEGDCQSRATRAVVLLPEHASCFATRRGSSWLFRCSTPACSAKGRPDVDDHGGGLRARRGPGRSSRMAAMSGTFDVSRAPAVMLTGASQ